jgi:hypothetical protein
MKKEEKNIRTKIGGSELIESLCGNGEKTQKFLHMKAMANVFQNPLGNAATVMNSAKGNERKPAAAVRSANCGQAKHFFMSTQFRNVISEKQNIFTKNIKQVEGISHLESRPPMLEKRIIRIERKKKKKKEKKYLCATR